VERDRFDTEKGKQPLSTAPHSPEHFLPCFLKKILAISASGATLEKEKIKAFRLHRHLRSAATVKPLC
jgi:hypothetical protein